jgi:hypothetical protein
MPSIVKIIIYIIIIIIIISCCCVVGGVGGGDGTWSLECTDVPQPSNCRTVPTVLVVAIWNIIGPAFSVEVPLFH